MSCRNVWCQALLFAGKAIASHGILEAAGCRFWLKSTCCRMLVLLFDRMDMTRRLFLFTLSTSQCIVVYLEISWSLLRCVEHTSQKFQVGKASGFAKDLPSHLPASWSFWIIKGQENSTMWRFFVSEYPHVLHFKLVLVVCFHMLLSHVIPISPHLKHVTHRCSLRSMSFSHAYISVASFISPGWSHTWLSFQLPGEPWWTRMNPVVTDID